MSDAWRLEQFEQRTMLSSAGWAQLEAEAAAPWASSAVVQPLAAPTAVGPVARPAAARAAAPAALAGHFIDFRITRGAAPFAQTGQYRFVTSKTKKSYSIVGSATVSNSRGTYSYAKTATSVGSLVLTDAVARVTATWTLTFTSATAGTYTATSASGGSQRGSFVYT